MAVYSHELSGLNYDHILTMAVVIICMYCACQSLITHTLLRLYT